MAPLACLAILPVSRIKGRPPTSTVTENGAGVMVFSDIGDFLWLRVRAERSCGNFVSALAVRERRRVLTRLTKHAQAHYDKFRPNLRTNAQRFHAQPHRCRHTY